MTEWPKILEAETIQTGHLSHAVLSGDGSNFHRGISNVLVTYRRALCGVGANGLRIKLTEDMEPAKWSGALRPCPRCRVKARNLPTPRNVLTQHLTKQIESSVNRGHYVSEAAAFKVVWFLEDKGLLAPDWKTKIEEMRP